MEQDQGLKKTMGLFTALSIVVGIVIGGGVFFKPEAIYTATNGAPGLGIVAWIIGGIITLSAGLTVAEAAASITETGGMMIYIREMWGEKLSFLTGWMQVVLYYPGTVAALAVMFSEQFCQMIGDNSLRAVIAVMMIAIVTILNLLDAKFGSLVQSISTACKVVPIVILIVFGLIKGTGTNPILSPMLGNGVSFGVAFGQVLIATLFVYDGWINIGSIAGELKNPGKDLPKAIIGGISIVMALYIAINLAYLWVLPANELAKVSVPAAFGLAILAPDLYKYLYAQTDGSGLMMVGSAIIPLMGIVLIQDVILQSVNQFYYVLIALAIGVGVKFLCDMYLVAIPAINIYGAVIGGVLAFLTILILNHFRMQKSLKIKISIIKLLARPLLASICMSILIIAIKQGLGLFVNLESLDALIGLVLLIVIVVIASFVYLCVLVYTGGLRRGDLEDISPKIIRKLPGFLKKRLR